MHAKKLLLLFLVLYLIQPQRAQAQEPNGLHEPFKHQLLTKHFSFYSVTDSTLSKYYGDYLEDFLLCLNANFVPIPANWHLTFYLYPDLATLNLEGCARPPKRGIEGRYVEGRNVVFTYETCGIGTMSHELMHKIVHENFKDPEPWAKEGIPTFFENIYGYKRSEGPVFYMGYQSPWRITELEKQLTHLTVAGIVDPAASVNPFQESDKRLLATFLFHEGKLFEYFKVARSGEHRGYKTLIEAAFQQPLPLIEPRFKEFVQTISTNKVRLLKIPKAEYFHSQAEFDKFEREHRDAFQAKPSLPEAKMRFTSAGVAN